MKILIVHNEYARPSGEEAVVDKMAEIFRGLGHEVAQLRMSTANARDSLKGNVRGFLAGIYSFRGRREMRRALRRERPDVVNVHNLYPFISPAALFECRRAGVPVVMTIHNFRLICPTGLFMRDNRPCELCLEHGNEWGCILHNCEGQRLKSLGYALRGWAARANGAYRKCVTRFACITDFQRRKLVEAGYDAARITVIPNAAEPLTLRAGGAFGSGAPSAEGAPSERGGASREGGYVGFCGRISREKGVDLIVEVARRHPEMRFRLAGGVRDKWLVEDLPENVELAGFLSGKDLDDFYRGARFMVMASRWYEGFPMAILEGARYARATVCLLYTSPSPRDRTRSRMPSSA